MSVLPSLGTALPLQHYHRSLQTCHLPSTLKEKESKVTISRDYKSPLQWALRQCPWNRLHEGLKKLVD